MVDIKDIATMELRADIKDTTTVSVAMQESTTLVPSVAMSLPAAPDLSAEMRDLTADMAGTRDQTAARPNTLPHSLIPKITPILAPSQGMAMVAPHAPIRIGVPLACIAGVLMAAAAFMEVASAATTNRTTHDNRSLHMETQSCLKIKTNSEFLV
jgi:hypothetical protein